MDTSTRPRQTPAGEWVAATTELKSQGWGQSLRRHRLRNAIGQFVSQFNAPQETEASEAASEEDENTSGTNTPIYSEKFEVCQGEFFTPSFRLPGRLRIATDTFVPRLVTFGDSENSTSSLGADQILAPLAGNSNTYPGMNVTCGKCLRRANISQSSLYSPPSFSTYSQGGHFGLSLGTPLFIWGFCQEVSRKFSPITNSNRATLFKASL